MASVQAWALELLRLTLWLGILAAVFAPLERLFALRRHVGRMRQAPADIAFYFLNSLIPLMLLTPALALLAVGMRALTPPAYLALIGSAPLWAKLGLGIVVSELGGYWGHRLSHQIPLLWRFHAVHHAPRHVDWLISSRAHPVDEVFAKLTALTPVYVFGLAQPSPQGLGIGAAVAVFGLLWGFLIHANVRWRLGPVEWIISSPAFHHWHHTKDADYRDRNFAALLPVFDRLFGTHYLPRRWPDAYGIDEPHPATLAEQLVRPFQPAQPLTITATTAPD